MSLDWNHIDKASKLVDFYFFIPFYNELNSLSKEYRFIRLSAPLVGVIDGIMSLAQAVVGVAEATLKGSRNLILGGLNCNAESLKKGGLQIVLGGCFVGIVSIPIIFVRTLRITAGMFINPLETTRTQYENYRRKVFASSPVAAST